MALYSVQIKPSAVKELESIPRPHRLRIVRRIHALALEPRPNGSEKLSGLDQYRVRQGNYRIVYSITDTEKTVIVYRIAHRREAYR